MSKYKGKKVLVVGFGVSGVSVAKYMTKQGAKVTVTDTKQKSELTESVAACADLKIEYELGKHNEATFKAAEMIVMSPGVPLNIKALEGVRELGIQITNEIDLAAAALKEPLIAVSGTNGKTTTTTLIGEMFKADARPAYVGGNIGKPLLDYLTDAIRADVVVAELSSFQLELTQKVVPAVAVITNVEPDHLDRYPSYEAYIAAKKRLLQACDKNTYVVLNYDNEITRSFGQDCVGRLMWITKKNPISIGGAFAENFNGCYYVSAEKKIYAKIFGKEETYDVSRIKVYGEHNKENFMAAICAVRAMGVSPQAIQKVIEEFRGIAHRLEFVRKKDGVFFFNDSKATNPQSQLKAIGAFPTNPIILIAGGKDKNFDFTPLADVVRQRCKLLILMGEAKEKMNRALGDFAETYLVGTFEEAVLLAFQKSRNGDIILLSPGCSSFDMFRNYEERGDYFKKLVHQL
ncbi:MAG: UDP-N-acetylmuramoyl-L-alanine--D-glutamate ligase [Cryobacterium sp.]|nr:UDP-N-acetylmuramoyl-L-alanine--D-glutamate ligase [Oligoflexia bacterium]